MKKSKEMKKDKEKSKWRRVMLAVALVLVAVSIINTFVLITLAGKATEGSGQVSLCINHPPTIQAISNQSVDHNSMFTLQINATDSDNHSLVYYDNTTLFNISNSTGLINFTPTIVQIGNYSILITVRDYTSSCPANVSTAFNLNIYNLPPVNNATIPNQSWEIDVWLTGLDLDNYFYDPENDTLSYSSVHGDNIEIDINSLNVVTFYPDVGWNGVTWARFIASDTLATKESNNLTLGVGDVTPPTIFVHQPNITESSNKLKSILKVSISERGTIKYRLNNQSNVTLCTSCFGGIKNITLPYFGNHSITIYAIDMYGNLNSKVHNFTNYLDSDNDGIPDSEENDADNDGLNDTNDCLIGDASNVNFNFGQLNLTINGSTNLSKQFSGNNPIRFTNGTLPILEFDYNFSFNYSACQRLFRLSEIILEKQENNAARGSVLVRGVNLSTESTKTIYVDRINSSGNVCLKDADITEISEISSGCNETGEYNLTCPGSLGNYTCSVLTSQYKITGVTHSGAIELTGEAPAAETPSSSSSSSSGGGGGGGGGSYKIIEEKIIEVGKNATCEAQTKCTPWIPVNCTSPETQNQTCILVRTNCIVVEKVIEKVCGCVPQWECSVWSECTLNDIQIRTCTDKNNCGQALGMDIQKECEFTNVEAEIKPSAIALVGKAFWGGLKRSADYGVYWITLVMLLPLILFLVRLRNGKKISILFNDTSFKVDEHEIKVCTVVCVNQQDKVNLLEKIKTSHDEEFKIEREIE
jgi:hypothetical protein